MIYDHSKFSAANAYRANAETRITRFMPMVRKMAWHLVGSGGPTVDLDDLMQAGLVALTECVQRHQRPDEDGFAAYAKTRVRGAMIDLLRKSAFQPRGARARAKHVAAARERMAGILGRQPTDAEVAEHVNLTVADVAQALCAAEYRSVPLDEATSDIEAVSADATRDPEEMATSSEERELLVRAVGCLPERQALVVQLYFVEELNLAEISAVLGVSVPRVHQIKASALDALRKSMEDCLTPLP